MNMTTHILPALLDGVHQTVKVGAERLQTRRIQEETALAGGVRGSARGIGALLRGGNLLLEISALARVEAQVRHWDGGHVHIIILRTWSIGKSAPWLPRV